MKRPPPIPRISKFIEGIQFAPTDMALHPITSRSIKGTTTFGLLASQLLGELTTKISFPLRGSTTQFAVEYFRYS